MNSGLHHGVVPLQVVPDPGQPRDKWAARWLVALVYHTRIWGREERMGPWQVTTRLTVSGTTKATSALTRDSLVL